MSKRLKNAFLSDLRDLLLGESVVQGPKGTEMEKGRNTHRRDGTHRQVRQKEWVSPLVSSLAIRNTPGRGVGRSSAVLGPDNLCS